MPSSGYLLAFIGAGLASVATILASDRGCRLRAGEPVSVNSRTSLRSAETEIGKWRAETGARNPRPKDGNARNCPQRLAPASLTRGKINDFHRPGKISQETELRGWGGRIRTSAWRNQNPLLSAANQSLSLKDAVNPASANQNPLLSAANQSLSLKDAVNPASATE
jgi:hypothetical protein